MATFRCRNVTSIPDNLAALTGARVCGILGRGPETFSACCSGAIYNGSEVAVESGGSQQSYAGCLTYCITDLTKGQFSSCLEQQPDYDHSKPFCRGADSLRVDSATNDAARSSALGVKHLVVLLIVGVALALPTTLV
ncbi:hypothetical protein ACQY0O_000317 [Thecaphora frezii]